MAHIFADNVREGSTSTGTGDFTTNGGVGPTPTAVIGRTIDSVTSAGDTFEYIIHHTTAFEWEVGLGTYNGTNVFTRTRVVSGSNGTSRVNFSAGDKVVWIGPTSELRQRFADLYNIVTYGAINGLDNSTSISLARTAAGVNRPIIAPWGSTAWGVKENDLIGAEGTRDREGTGLTFSQGTESNPSNTVDPILYLEKVSSSSSSAEDHGVMDMRLTKVGGTQNARTFWVALEATGGNGSHTPFVSYAVQNGADPLRMSGGIFYAEKRAPMISGPLVGFDVTMVDNGSGQDVGWLADPGDTAGAVFGLNLFSSGRATLGVNVATLGVGNGYYTGYFVGADAILPSSFDTDSEAFRIQGSETNSNRYGGIWLQNGYFTYGINLAGPTFESNTAILMSKDSRITFGSATTDSTSVWWMDTDKFNINGGTLAVDQTQVVGPRETGWTAMTGSASKGGFATGSVTLPQLAQVVKALSDAMITHGLIGA